MGKAYTDRLGIRRVQETDQFADEAFNLSIDDIDAKVLGLDHLESPGHWAIWEPDTSYQVGDIVRYKNLESYQYVKYITAGTSGTTEPTNNVTDSIVQDGTAQFIVTNIGGGGSSSGGITIWLGGGYYYERGQAVLYGNALYRAKIAHQSSTTFDLDKMMWQEVFASIRPWNMNVYYFENDTVLIDNWIYRCIKEHTSAATFNSAEEANWVCISSVMIQDWQQNTSFKKGQIVKFGDLYFVADSDHVSGTSFYQDGKFSHLDATYLQYTEWKPSTLYAKGIRVTYAKRIWQAKNQITSGATFDATERNKWDLTDTKNYVFNWNVNDLWYEKDDLCIYDDITYVCKVSHVPTDFNTQRENWTLLSANVIHWKANQAYLVDTIVYYNDKLYRCIKKHTSNDFDNDYKDACWTTAPAPEAELVVLDWKPETEYKKNQLVMNDGILYRCLNDHTSATTFMWTEVNNFEAVDANIPEIKDNMSISKLSVFRWRDHLYYTDLGWYGKPDADDSWHLINAIEVWEKDIFYPKGMLLINDGKLYYVNSYYFDSTFNGKDSRLTLLSGEGGSSSDVFGGIVEWEPNTSYKEGQLIYYKRLTYRALSDFTSPNVFNDTNLEILNTGYLDYWEPQKEYLIGMIVVRKTSKSISLLRCIVDHLSEASYTQSESNNWEEIISSGESDGIKPWASNTDYEINDVVIYNNELYLCLVNHTSQTAFYLDMTTGNKKWKKLTGDNSLFEERELENWKQVEAFGITAPEEVNISINITTDFCRPPLEILKKKDQEKETDYMIDDFDDTANSIYKENKFIAYDDSAAHPRIKYLYKIEEINDLVDGFVCTSEEIDFKEFVEVYAEYDVYPQGGE